MLGGITNRQLQMRRYLAHRRTIPTPPLPNALAVAIAVPLLGFRGVLFGGFGLHLC